MKALRVALGTDPRSSLPPHQVFSIMMIGWQLWFWLIYWIVAGAIQAYRYYERYMNTRVAAGAAGAQLQRGAAATRCGCSSIRIFCSMR